MGYASWAQAPKADVLDIVFNGDGTVSDVSAMQNPVTVKGYPDFVKSPMYNMNVLCQAEESSGNGTTNYVRVDYNDKLLSAISDGMTMEILVRPYFEGGYLHTNNWINAFGCFQGGGFGIIINESKWDFEAVIGGGYKDAIYDAPVVGGEWIHLTGVWDKEAAQTRLYVNGNLVSTAENAGGELSLPSGDNRFVGVGVDYEPKSQSNAGNLFQGDIAIARIYDKPLTDEEVAAAYQEAEARKTGNEEHDEEDMALRTDGEGTVLIANAGELEAFGHAVRMGQTSLDAKLEADIDFTAARKPLSNSKSYSGTFDGQGHSITINLENGYGEVALFQSLKSATVKDLHISGTVTTGHKFAAGLAAGSNDNTLVENVSCDADIISRTDGDGTHGGIIALNNSGVTLRNCLFSGSITGETTNCCSGLVGWSSGKTTIENCLVAAEFNTDESNCCTMSRNPGNVTVINSYYTTPYGEADNGAVQVDESQTANGEACWLLNGSNMTNTAWRQTLENDEMPVPDKSHGLVVCVGEGAYMCISDEASLAGTRQAYAEYMREQAEALEGHQPLIDLLLQHVTDIAASSTTDEFIENGKKIDKDLADIQLNLKAYEDFLSCAEDALGKLEGMINEYANTLRDYLESETEPGEEFPNGSFLYITNNFSLDTESIRKEIEYINDMLLKAMASGTAPGTDITMLLQNADFIQGAEGWEGSKSGDYVLTPSPAVQYYGLPNGTCYQTLTGLTNGLYELDMNAFEMIGDDNYCSFYCASIFAGDMEMPVMSPMEGAISIDEAVDGENCYLRNDRLVDGMYYIPYSREGGAVAMNGGRYLNRIMVNVTDGTLTVGSRLDGSGLNNDWLMFANTKLFYQGSMEEAGEALDKTLECAVARANTTINYTADAAGSNYRYLPNYSESLRNELKGNVEAVADATTAAGKYAVLQKFSDLFKQIYASRMAYVQCARELETFNTRIDDYPDYADELQAMYENAWNLWLDGAYSTEEALAKGSELFAELEKYAVELPEADLMDIVFSGDGTAKDVSATGNTVGYRGTPVVVESQQLGINVYCGAANDWGGIPEDFFYVNASEALVDGISDGMTMEILARAYWDGERVPGGWASVIGMQEGGGMGMLVYNRQWDFESHIGGGYKDAYSGSDPVKDEWTHLVGVWNPENSTLSLYVNGILTGTDYNAGGTYQRPNLVSDWLGIGCDPDGKDSPSAAFKGDIAIARIYNEPVTASQAALLYKKVENMMGDAAEHGHPYIPDGIGGVEEESGRTSASGIYDLAGRKVSSMNRKGIYIVNGRKMIR